MKTDRRNFIKTSGLAGTGLLFGCHQNRMVQSLNGLKIAYVRESTTEAKYLKFALKAREEKYPRVAAMFIAISKAEGIHAANHLKVLHHLKMKYPVDPVGDYEVKSTIENIQNGLMTENYEIENMYPAFIKQAKAEKQLEAVHSFTLAFQVEIQHQAYYNLAITAFGTGKEMNLPEFWYVCPDCGGTYAKEDLKKTCNFDSTPRTQFLEFT